MCIQLLRIALWVAMKTMQFHIHITQMSLFLENIVFCIKVVILKELPPLIYCLRVQGRS